MTTTIEAIADFIEEKLVPSGTLRVVDHGGYGFHGIAHTIAFYYFTRENGYAPVVDSVNAGGWINPVYLGQLKLADAGHDLYIERLRYDELETQSYSA